MFISYETQKYLGYDDKTQQYKYLYKIIDSDFEEKAVSVTTACAGSGFGVFSAIIDVYEKRNLNVAANLAILFQYQHNKFNDKISNLIKWNKLHNPKYLKYSTDVERLMLWV